MPSWRVSLVFRNSVGVASTSTSLFGWTESVYSSGTPSRANVQTNAFNLMFRRRALLSPGWRISKIRYSQYPFTRVAFSDNIPPSQGQGQYSLAGNAGDEQPYDRLIINMVCASGGSRALELGGIGSNVVDAGGTYLAPAAWVNVFPAWLQQMILNWAVLRRGATDSRQLYAVFTTPQSWDSAISPYSPVLQIANFPAALTPPVTIRISPAPGTCGLAGVWTINRSTGPAGSIYYGLAPKRGNQVIGVYGGGSRIIVSGSSFDAFTDGTPGRGTSRRTGGSIDRPRGRRSRRR